MLRKRQFLNQKMKDLKGCNKNGDFRKLLVNKKGIVRQEEKSYTRKMEGTNMESELIWMTI